MDAPAKLNMSSDEYHAHPAIGSTGLKLILKSPAHYKYEKENPSEPTPAMKRGTAIHEAILEPDLFLKNSVVMPKFEGTGSRAAKDEWLMENHGKRILSADDRENIKGILGALSAHKTARALLAGGAAETSYFWQDPITGLMCKCRPDFLRKGHIIVDIKSTFDASPEAFPKQIANLKMHLSGAHYLAGVTAVEGVTYDQFILIAVEPEAPHGISVHLLDEATIEVGEMYRRRALKTLAECRDTDQYPCYPDSILTTAIPHWAFPAEAA